MISHVLRLVFLCFGLIVFVLSSPVSAKRIALVIGNNNYQNLQPDQQLKKARADADTISETLRSIGFQVMNGRDVGRADFNLKIIDLANRIEPGDVVTFFFAGHGVRLDGRNYLLASDVPGVTPARRELLKSESIAVDSLTDQFRARGARVSFLILDACRNDPFVDNTGRSVLGTRGLARVEPPEGTFVLFSAGAGQVALDRLPGDDPHPNSVFTRKLAPLLKQPGLELGRMSRLVRRQVRQLANQHGHAQLPASYNELIGDFYLTGKAPAASSSTQPQISSNPERDFERAERIGSIPAWEAFLSRHGSDPDSFYVQLAKAALGKLVKKSAKADALQPSVAEVTGRKIALVIGNYDYRAVADLKNARTDAQDIAAALRKQAFDVNLVENANLSKLQQTVQQLAGQMRNGSVSAAVVYYAGHGTASDGRFYILGADFEYDANQPKHGLSMSDIGAQLGSTGKPVIVLLDANFPAFDAHSQKFSPDAYTPAFRGYEGLTVAVAAEPGGLALDSFGNASRNSPFAHVLLRLMREKGDFKNHLARLASQVRKLTNGKQKPWYLANSRTPFFLAGSR